MAKIRVIKSILSSITGVTFHYREECYKIRLFSVINDCKDTYTVIPPIEVLYTVINPFTITPDRAIATFILHLIE